MVYYSLEEGKKNIFNTIIKGGGVDDNIFKIKIFIYFRVSFKKTTYLG